MKEELREDQVNALGLVHPPSSLSSVYPENCEKRQQVNENVTETLLLLNFKGYTIYQGLHQSYKRYTTQDKTNNDSTSALLVLVALDLLF